MTTTLNQDSMAIVLLCTNIGIGKNNTDLKPYTIKQWNQLSAKIANSILKSPAALFDKTVADLKDTLLITEDECQKIRQLLGRAGQAAIELESFNSMGIYVTTRAEDNYPKRLKTILKKDCPPVLFYSGDIEIAKTDGIGIVGSRSIDNKALEFTKTLSSKCTQQGFTVISGGAKGVDEVAQNKALRQGGKVISIIAESLTQKIKQKEVREAILDGKLLILSAFHPRAPFTVYNAMQRNKYIYGLSKSTVAVSSDYSKGGTWAGATENLRNRYVPLFVRQDDFIPEGNEKLIKMGANPLVANHLFNDSFNVNVLRVNSDNTMSMESPEQGSLFTAANVLEDEIEYNSVDDSVITEEVTVEQEDHDLFLVVWPYLEKALKEAKTKEDLCGMFNLNKSQLTIWLDRAVEEEKVKKVSKPTRYVIS